jgi:hypothetical protein
MVNSAANIRWNAPSYASVTYLKPTTFRVMGSRIPQWCYTAASDLLLRNPRSSLVSEISILDCPLRRHRHVGGHAAVFEPPLSQREADVIFKSSLCSIWKGTDLFGCVLRARHKRATTLCAGPSGTCTKASKIDDVSPFDATNWFGQPRYFVMN